MLTRRALMTALAFAAPAAWGQDKPAPPAPEKKPDAPPPVPLDLPAVTALAFQPDGKTLAVGTFGRVLLYDPATWQPATTCTVVEDFARALAFSPDGKMLAIGSGRTGISGRVTLWDMAGTAARLLSRNAADTIETLAYRADGDGLLFGANDRKACYIARLSSNLATYMDEHNGRVLAVALSPKPAWIYATGGMDKIVKVWDEPTQKPVVNFDQAEAGITGLAFLNNGDQFVGSSLDGRLYWWGVNFDKRRRAYSGYSFRRVDAHEGGVLCMSMAKDGKRIATGGHNHIACVWDAEGGGRQREFKDATQPIYAVAVSPDSKLVATGGREGLVRVYDVDANKLLTTFYPPVAPPRVGR